MNKISNFIFKTCANCKEQAHHHFDPRIKRFKCMLCHYIARNRDMRGVKHRKTPVISSLAIASYSLLLISINMCKEVLL